MAGNAGLSEEQTAKAESGLEDLLGFSLIDGRVGVLGVRNSKVRQNPKHPLTHKLALVAIACTPSKSLVISLNLLPRASQLFWCSFRPSQEHGGGRVDALCRHMSYCAENTCRTI